MSLPDSDNRQRLEHLTQPRDSRSHTTDKVLSFFLRRERVSWMEWLFWLVLASSYLLLPERMLLMTEAMVAALFALSLYLILGLGGMISLGHAALFGAGAYTAALFAIHVHSSPLLGLLAGGGTAALLGGLISLIAQRLQGIALLAVTMGLALVLHELVLKAYTITGGADGLTLFPGPILGMFELDFWGETGFIYSFVVLLSCFLLVRRLLHSPFGLCLQGLRENSRRLPALGITPSHLIVRVYLLSGLLAGIAGALHVQTTQFTSVNLLSFERSAEVLIMLALGGVGYLYGGLVGGITFIVLRDSLAELDPKYWHWWMGALLISLVLFSREGIVGLGHAVIKRKRP